MPSPSMKKVSEPCFISCDMFHAFPFPIAMALLPQEHGGRHPDTSPTVPTAQTHPDTSRTADTAAGTGSGRRCAIAHRGTGAPGRTVPGATGLLRGSAAVDGDAVDPRGDHLRRADPGSAAGERIAVEDGEVGDLARRDGAGVVAVVRPGRPTGVRRERGSEVDRLLR